MSKDLFRIAVNRQLEFIHYCINQLDIESNVQENSHSLKCLIESTLFHIHLLQNYYIQEIAFQAGNLILDKPPNNLEDIIKRLEFKGCFLAEIEEINQCDWWQDIDNSFNELGFITHQTAINTEVDSHLIKMTNLDKPNKKISAEQLKNWLLRLEEMIARHRSLAIEY